MHIETQTKSHSAFRYLAIFSLFGALFSISGCSFVELQPGAQTIIFAKPGDGCKILETFQAQVKTRTLWMKRDPKVIAEELQIQAQNQAYKLYANAIWPFTEAEDGKQRFEIMSCEPLSE